MSASNSAETALLQLLLQNIDFAGLGDAGGLRGSVAPGNLFIALHSADPGEAGTQATSEANYTGYARVAVVRSAAGWTVSGNAYQNAAVVTFPACTGGSTNASHYSIGIAASGGTMILLKGSLTGTLAISNGITPAFPAGALSGTAD